MAQVVVRAYPSPSCVLLAFDWSDGANHEDFLGFAISRTPGYTKDGKTDYLFNKLDFQPIGPHSKPKGSDKAPIQKFNWWDSGINTSDQGKTFDYTITPVLGTGANDLRLASEAAQSLKVTVPNNRAGDIETYFNRAVVSSQSFLNVDGGLEKKMQWLANGMQAPIPDLLAKSNEFDGAIYHLTDNLWILPAFKAFNGVGSLTYFSKGKDTTSQAAIDILAANPSITPHKRDAISKLMHDKFIVSSVGGQGETVLMGSANFTPEGQTIQANLLHVFHSRELAELYKERSALLAQNKPTEEITKFAGWKDVSDVAGTDLRVFFPPEPEGKRLFLETVTAAVKAAKSSVLFCMFTASDSDLMKAIFEKADSPDHIVYGVLNSVDDPDKPTKTGKPRKLPEIAATIFHRASTKPDTLHYAAFGKNAPAGFLPELRTINCKPYDVSADPAKPSSVPPIHIHHKFIVIDGDTDHPTIYSGSPNFSKSSENDNDENVLEIKNNTDLAHAYVAEFMRLYNHYRARAIWNRNHEDPNAKADTKQDPLVLKTTRDGWAFKAYQGGSKEFLSRVRGL